MRQKSEKCFFSERCLPKASISNGLEVILRLFILMVKFLFELDDGGGVNYKKTFIEIKTLVLHLVQKVNFICNFL